MKETTKERVEQRWCVRRVRMDEERTSENENGEGKSSKWRRMDEERASERMR